MSTNDRARARAARRARRSAGIATLECPVTGGVHLAAAGEITVIAGGDEAVFARAPRRCSRRSAARSSTSARSAARPSIKVITNMLAFIHLVAAGEALMLAKRGGIDLAPAYEAIRASSGNASCTRPRAS